MSFYVNGYTAHSARLPTARLILRRPFFVALIANPISSGRILRYLHIYTEFVKYNRFYERHLVPESSGVKLDTVFVYTTLEILFMVFLRAKNVK